jgi:hypothetical protein
MLDLFSTPYPLPETLGMIRRRFLPPEPRANEGVFSHRVVDSDRSTDQWIGFVGDISPLQGRTVRYDAVIERFFENCSHVVGNLEGVITDQPWFPYLHNHRLDLFEALETLIPLDRWVLSLANNHALDYGPRGLQRTVRECQRRGVKHVGTTEVPRVRLGNEITVTSWTWWLNRTGDGVVRENPGKLPANGLHVAYPHWGYEHERRPRSIQRERLPAGYAAVVGHHSHLPQPVDLVDDRRPVAWSLGNFITTKQLPVLGEGAVVKLGIAVHGRTPAVTEVISRDICIKRPLRENFCAVVPAADESPG